MCIRFQARFSMAADLHVKAMSWNGVLRKLRLLLKDIRIGALRSLWKAALRSQEARLFSPRDIKKRLQGCTEITTGHCMLWKSLNRRLFPPSGDSRYAPYL